MDSFGFTVLKMGNENNFDFRKEAINGLNALCMKAKRIRGLVFEEKECLITDNNNQRNGNQFKDLTRDELILKLLSYIKKVNELEKERTLRTEFFTNIVEELEKEKISLISEKNSLKETSLKRKSNVNEVFEEKNKATKPVESEEISSKRSNVTRSLSDLPSLPKRSKPNFRGLISQMQKRNKTEVVKRCLKSESTPRQYKRTRIDNNDQRLEFENTDDSKDEVQYQEMSLETISSPDRFDLKQEIFEHKEGEIESDEVLETINSPEHSYAPSHVSSENSLDNSIEKSMESSKAFDLKQEKFELEEGEIEFDEDLERSFENSTESDVEITGKYDEVCFAFSNFDESNSEKDKYINFLMCHGAKIFCVNTFNMEPTHVISEKSSILSSNGSFKMMCSAAAGKWILHPSYIEACMKENVILSDCEKFEWGNPENSFIEGNGNDFAQRNQFEKLLLSAYQIRIKKTAPFEDIKAIIHPSASNKEDLRRLLLAGKGTIIEDFRGSLTCQDNRNGAMIMSGATHCLVQDYQVKNKEVNIEAFKKQWIDVITPSYLYHLILFWW